MSNMIKGAYPVFTDIDGSPIEDGYIFIGEPTLDPITNPIDVYWDEELTVPATNIRTRGGYPNNSGVPGRLFVEGTYSILVQNKRGTEVYSETTFFEAGEEFLTLSGSAINSTLISFARLTDDAIRLSFNWNEIPKQSTGLSLSYSSLQLYEYNASLRTYTFDGSEVLGTAEINKEEVSIIVTKVAAFANFTNAGNTVRSNTLIATLT